MTAWKIVHKTTFLLKYAFTRNFLSSNPQIWQIYSKESLINQQPFSFLVLTTFTIFLLICKCSTASFFLQLSSIYLGAIAREILLTRYNVMIWVSVVEVIWIIPQRNPHFLKEFLEVVTSSIISVESKWNVRIPEERYNEIVHQTSM